VLPDPATYPATGPPPAGTSWGCFSFAGDSQHAWYVQAAGTSGSTPIAAGVAALVKSAKPSLQPSQIRTILQQTAQDIGKNGYDSLFNFGLVNATAAVQAATGR
jgi:subtilisin family serine protease